jgi:hypothetical protein
MHKSTSPLYVLRAMKKIRFRFVGLTGGIMDHESKAFIFGSKELGH